MMCAEVDEMPLNVRKSIDMCMRRRVDHAIADILQDMPGQREIKALSQLGMVEVPSNLAKNKLVFIDEFRTASG